MSCKRKWHCRLLWIWGGGVGVKQISNSLLSFPIILLLPIYLFISTMFFSLFSTLNWSLTFFSEFKQKKTALPFNSVTYYDSLKFHTMLTYKPLLFSQEYTKGKGGWNGLRLNLAEEKFPIIFKAQASNWGRRKTLLGQNCLSQPENARRRKTWGLLQP